MVAPFRAEVGLGRPSDQQRVEAGRPTQPLLVDKLLPPLPAPWLVPRPALVSALDAAIERPVTVVVGVAGSGKSTVLGQWAAAARLPVAWLHLDFDDDFDDGQPEGFWTYVAAALREVVPNGGAGVLDAIADTDDPRRVATALLHEAESWDRPAALVLDGVERVDSSIGAALAYVADHLPPSLRLVLAARHDPPLALPRLRVRGALSEIRDRELRLRADETHELLTRAGKGVNRGEAAELTERYEGWVTGLRLASAVDRQRSEDPVAAAREFLVREVLAPQPDRLRQFLLETSVLDRLSGPLCDAVTGRSDGAVVLRELEARNLFVEPVDDDRTWYRYHRSFAATLRAELERHDADRVRTAHRAAATWFEERGDASAAIEHHLAAGDHHRAWRSTAAAEDDGLGSLTRLVGRVPEPFVRAAPNRMFDLAMDLLREGRVDEAEAWARRLERALNHPAAGPELRSRALIAAGACRFWRGELEAAIEALAATGDEARAATGSVVPLALVVCHTVAGDYDRARTAYTSWQASAGGADREAAGALALVAWHEGLLREAASLADVALSGEPVEDRAACGYQEAAFVQAAVLGERNRRREAELRLEAALEAGERSGRLHAVVLPAIELARLWSAAGRVGEACQLLDEIRWTPASYSLADALEARIDVAEAQVLLAAGEPERAEMLSRALPFNRRSWLLTVRVALALDDVARASALLAQPPAADARLTLRQRIEVDLLRARTLLAVGDDDAAMAPLQRALQGARPERYVRLLLADAEPLVPLLQRALAERPSGYLSELLEEAAAAPVPAASAGRPVEPLTDREQIVVQLLCSRLPNQALADQLGISLNTFKTHVRSVYRKLAAGSRSQALANARFLGLL